MADDYNGSVQLGERLRRKRKSEKKHQLEIAELIGVPQGTYSRWENGVRAPEPKYLPAIAEYLGVDLRTVSAWLLAPGATDPLEERVNRVEEGLKELTALIRKHLGIAPNEPEQLGEDR